MCKFPYNHCLQFWKDNLDGHFINSMNINIWALIMTLATYTKHREYLVCSYLRSGKISNWWQLCNLRSPAGSLRRLLVVCSNAAVLSAAVLRKKTWERKGILGLLSS